MKTFTRSIQLISLSILMIITINCTKIANDPIASLKVRTERVSNTWMIEKYIENGIDRTHEFTEEKAGYIETYYPEGNFTFSFNDQKNEYKTGSCIWMFQNYDKELARYSVTGEEGYNGSIVLIRLRDKELWYSYTENHIQKEFHMVPKTKNVSTPSL